MKIYFLRHTTLDIDDDIFYGQTDVDVSANFLKEVSVIKKKLKDEGLDFKKTIVVTSPLKRCKKLAKKICDNFTVDPRLKELNLGDWELKKISSIPKQHIKQWENNILDFQIPNGETNKKFLDRLKRFLNDSKQINQDLLVVTHAGSINGMISILTKEPFDKLVKNYWEKIKHGSLTCIEVNENKVRINFLGR